MKIVNSEFEGVSPVKYSDKEDLHYTMSVLTEIERVVLVGEATMAHEASQDVLVCGVRIPKGGVTYECGSFGFFTLAHMPPVNSQLNKIVNQSRTR